MKFSEEFTCITGGAVWCVQRGSNEERDMSKFGEDLVYINAGLVEHYREAAGTDESEFRRRLVYLASSIREHLESEGGSVRAIAMIQHLFMSAQHRKISYPGSAVDET